MLLNTLPWIPTSLRKCKFYDLSRIAPADRKPRSSILQFYSSINNIGNFLPVLGIQQMLGHRTDTWCIHDRHIDFEFVNRNYPLVIIGGAGLLHKCFNPFWEKFQEQCHLPTLIWGVGTCFPDSDPVGANSEAVQAVAQRSELVNVRDDLTANYYQLDRVSITACPTLAYLQNSHQRPLPKQHRILFSSHEELVSDRETQQIRAELQRLDPQYRYTNNLQRRFSGLDFIVQQYQQSQVVVSTRLHGAIIAYGLGVPYVILARDEKLRAFHRLYGNGISIDAVEELEDGIQAATRLPLAPIQLDPVLAFGRQAQAQVAAKIASWSQVKIA